MAEGINVAEMDIEGVYVPVATPFTASGEIDLDGYAKVIGFVLDGGVRGLVPCGTTGEYYALSHDERVAQFTMVRDIAKGKAQLVAGCNAGSTRECIAFAQTARDLGYDAIMLAAPPTSLPTQSELADHFIEIAEGGGLPTILYNFPARAGIEIGFDCLDAVVDHPGIAAIKESSGDFSRFLAMRKRYTGRITIMCGSDDQAVDYFAWGVRSWLAGTGNVLPREHAEIMARANAGDIDGARRSFDAILPWVQNMEAGQYNQKIKLGLGHQGIECGPVRAPLRALPADMSSSNLAALRDAIAAYSTVS
jgi:4-hydroxy-tetrahydrodipicolinate synthase